MRRKFGLRYLLVAFLLVTSGCYDKPTPMVRDATLGGALGTAAGAGIGAIIGSVISNGDVAMSALMGSGVGLASGIILAVTYRSLSEKNEILSNESRIAENEQELIENYRTIGSIRSDLTSDQAGVELDPSRQEYQYTGPSLGTYNR